MTITSVVATRVADGGRAAAGPAAASISATEEATSVPVNSRRITLLLSETNSNPNSLQARTVRAETSRGFFLGGAADEALDPVVRGVPGQPPPGGLLKLAQVPGPRRGHPAVLRRQAESLEND